MIVLSDKQKFVSVFPKNKLFFFCSLYVRATLVTTSALTEITLSFYRKFQVFFFARRFSENYFPKFPLSYRIITKYTYFNQLR